MMPVSNYSAGNVTAVLGDTEGTDRSSNATFTETITAGAGGDIDIRADLDFIGDIDDVSVKAIAVTLGVSTGGDSGGSPDLVYRITRGPKIYDPSANTLSLWLATTTKGEVPTSTRLISLYRGRISLTGDPALPNVWYHSRQDDPLDWQYADTDDDVARAILGQNNDFGIVGEPITAQIPFSDDFLIFGASNSIWVLRGDAAFNGQIDNVSFKSGIISGDAFTFGPSGEIVFLGRDGIYMMPPGAASVPVSISNQYLPNSLRDIDPSAFQVSIEYDIIEEGVHIYITPVSGGVQKYYWMDWENKRFFPSILQTSHEPMKTLSFTSVDNILSVLHGSRDGFIRRYSRSSVTDEGFDISSHVLLGPFYLGGSELFNGVLRELQIILGKNSGDVKWKLYVGDTHQEVISDAVLGGAVSNEGTVSSGFNFSKRVDRRGSSAVLRIEGISGQPAWALEQIIGVSRDAGRLRKLV